ncbi:hypothetical protein LJC59_03705 [Desulfovibrio sp. OttesenSCG-928-A18]|nr:hypothetical protein [Desulfovibrio sp. OttesenSCG-928-A18]
MSAASQSSVRYFFAVLFLLLLVCAASLAAWRVYSGAPAKKEEALDRYLRAVYVLQSLGGPAAAEREDIPARIRGSDAAESLLHHPDKIFILQHIADELAQTGDLTPRAALFEAYARLALGERQRAVALLTRYVMEDDYESSHYEILAANLYELRDYSSLYLICREWAERDAACRENRTRYTWTSLYNLKRFGQSLEYMQKQAPCLGWQARIYAAKSALASGDARSAEEMLLETLERFPADATLIQRMWEQLRDREIM